MRVGLKVWWTSMSRHQRSCKQWRICLPRLGDKVRRGHNSMHQTLSLSHLQSTTQKINQFYIALILLILILKDNLLFPILRKIYLAVICFFHFVLLFWNHVLIWTSVRWRVFDNSNLFETDKYLSAFKIITSSMRTKI